MTTTNQPPANARRAFGEILAEHQDQLTIVEATPSDADAGVSCFAVAHRLWPNHPLMVRIWYDAKADLWTGDMRLSMRGFDYAASLLGDELRGDLEPKQVVEALLGGPFAWVSLQDQVGREVREAVGYFRRLRRQLSKATPGEELSSVWVKPPRCVREHYGSAHAAKTALCRSGLRRRGYDFRALPGGREYIVRPLVGKDLRVAAQSRLSGKLSW